MGLAERIRHKRIREDVIARDGMKCCYCEVILTHENFSLDHIIPDSLHGTFNSTNLTVACMTHNNKRGNQPFFEYCKQFNWSPNKLAKYERLYQNNLKIKVLNIAKEECLKSEQEIPINIINQACELLKINKIDFSDYEKNNSFEIKFNSLYNRKKIKFCFEKLIRIIEIETG